MSRNADVSLVIRAKNEAARTIKSVASAMAQLNDAQTDVVGSAGKAGSRLEQLATGLSGLEAINRKIAASTEASSAAIARQAQSLVATNGQIAERRARVDELTRALGLLSREADAAFIGPRRNGLTDSIKTAKAELRTAQGDLTKLTGAFDRQLAGLQNSRAAFREIQSAQREAEAAAGAFTLEIAAQTAALDANSAAAKRAKAAQSFFNTKFAPGLDRPGTTADDREEIAAVLQVAQARDIGIQKLREEERATAELARTEEARRRAASLLPTPLSGKSAAESASVFRDADLQASKAFEGQLQRNAAAAREEGAAIERLRAELNPTIAVEARLAAETEKLTRWHRHGKISATEFAAAQKLLKDQAAATAQTLGAQPRMSLFGLRPHETQNLLFQFNDIATQLASGTSLSQTLIQQGLQIGQLFQNRVGPAIATAFGNPLVGAFIVALGTMALGLKRAGDEAERVRDFTAQLAINADGGDYNAQALSDAAKALDRYGLSAEDAVKAVRTFVKEGVDPTRITQFGIAAKNLSDVLGVDMTEAARMVADGFTGSYDSLKKFNDATNIFTAAELQMIAALEREGQAQRARATAADIAFRKLQEGADKARGPWSEAARAFGNAWGAMVDKVADADPIAKTITLWDELGRTVARALNRMAGTQSAADIVSQLGEKAKELLQLQQRLATARERFGGDGGIVARGLEREIARVRGDIENLRAQQQRLRDAQAKTSADTVAAAREKTKVADASLDKQLASLRAQNKAASDRERLQQAYIDGLEEARRLEPNASFEKQKQFALEKQAQLRSKLADEAKREADEIRRGYVADIADNGREGLISTARRFNGMSETRDRGSLQDFFRQNGINVDPKMTAWCAAFVNAVLATNGLKGTGSLAARSFLNFGQDASSDPREGDIVVLRRGGNNAQGHVGFFQGFDSKGNVRVLGGNQGDAVNTRSFARDDVLGIRRAPSLGQVATQEAQEAERLAKAQATFSENLDNTLESRRQDTEQLREQFGLQGQALLAKQREATIEDAIRKAKQEAEKAGVAADDPALVRRLELLRETEGAYFDATHARDIFEQQRQNVDLPVNDLSSLRDSLQQRIQFFQESGQAGLADQLNPQLDAVNAKLAEAIAKAQAFYASLSNNPQALAALGMTAEQVEIVRLKLDATAAAGQQTGYILGIAGAQIAQTFAGAATSAVDRFAQAVAQGSNVVRSFMQGFRDMAVDVLRNVAQMILQQQFYNFVLSITKALGGVGGGTTSAGTDATYGGTLGGIYHQGGIVGAGGSSRMVSPAWFANAARYHTGGIAGLRPNEVPAILERGEEVLTRGDPRHAANGGGAAPVVNLRNVNVFDAADALEKALSTRKGERVLMNHVRNNSAAWRGAMGG